MKNLNGDYLLLQISNLTVHYGAAQALFVVDLAVGQGETVALVGAIPLKPDRFKGGK